MDRIPERERIAKIEIGHTAISAALAWILVGIFLAAIVTPLLADLFSGRAAKTGVTFASLEEVGRVARREGGLAGCRALLRQMHQLEDGLERKSWLGDTLLPLAQRSLAAVGMGNEKVYLGRQRWLFYAPDLDYVTGQGFLEPSLLERRRRGGREWEAPPQPDPLLALRDFQRQLAKRGIALLVVPTPVKPMLESAPLAAHGALATPPQNPSWREFVRRLGAAGIELFDPTPILAEEKAAHGEPQYLRTDTHWTPRAVDLVAERLAARVKALADLGPARLVYAHRPQAIANSGDLAALLVLPATHPLKEPERVTIERVEGADGTPWKADPRAPVLLLGDSFTNIFSESDLGWGTGAGLAEQLSYHLGRSVDRVALNSGGALATRQRLAQELANGNDRLRGKKVVVYQFAARELAIGDWRLIDLSAPPE